MAESSGDGRRPGADPALRPEREAPAGFRAEAERKSPILHLPARSVPLVVTVGLGELPELIRQSAAYAEAWQTQGLPGYYLPIEAHDHFSILEELARPDGKLLAALEEMAKGARAA